MKSPDKKMRKRKVCYAYYCSPRASPHPVIRLSGKYLENFGFVIGDTVEVYLDQNQITIKKVLGIEAH